MSKRLKVLAGVAGVALAASMLAAMPAGAAASKAATAKSAKDVGGLAGLIKLAKAEGELNVIALPPDWANYGEMISTFSKKYGIKVNSANPDASSADELAAVKALKGQKRQPDVVDVGVAFAAEEKGRAHDITAAAVRKQEMMRRFMRHECYATRLSLRDRKSCTPLLVSQLKCFG